MEGDYQNPSAVFMQVNRYQTPNPRSSSKPFIYVSSNTPVKTNRIGSPFVDGRPNDGYISPTFMSGDCFYPHVKTPAPRKNSNQYETAHSRSKSPSINYSSASQQRSTLYDQYQSQNKPSHQKTHTQPNIRYQDHNDMDDRGRSPQVNTVQFTNTPPQSVNKKQNNQQNNASPQTPAQQDNQQSYQNYLKNYQEKINKNYNDNQPNTQQYQENNTPRYYSPSPAQTIKKETQQLKHKSPHSSCSNNTSNTSQTSSSLITQTICLNCFNSDLVDDHKKKNYFNKNKDKQLLEHNLDFEQKLIHQETDNDQQRKEKEKQLIKSEFEDFQRRKIQEYHSTQQQKEQQRAKDIQQSENILNQKKQDYEDQIQKRMIFLRGIEQQLEERENRRKVDRQRDLQYQQNLPNVLEIGEEYNLLPDRFQQSDRVSADVKDVLKQIKRIKQKQQQDTIQMYNDHAINEKAKQKDAQNQKDQEQVEYNRRKEELNTQRAQFEQLQTVMKKQQLNLGLDEQIKFKREREKRQTDREKNQLQQVNEYASKTQPKDENKYQSCDGCDKQYIQEFLSKVKRPKSKLKRFL